MAHDIYDDYPNQVFREFVSSHGVEFFGLAGDPKDLMKLCVDNGMFTVSFIREGVEKFRGFISDLLQTCWEACITPSSDPRVTKGVGMEDDTTHDLFYRPDALIANPPSMAHVHVAEKLCVPLHMSFTMPWSPTKAVPSPMFAMGDPGVESMTNYSSYIALDAMMWQGIQDMVNEWRYEVLHLPKLKLANAGKSLIHNKRVPYMYCFSQSLLPKPRDWGSHIDVCGFWFLGAPSNYEPPQDLVEFLEAGEPPIYVGFGSVIVPDPEEVTNIIFEALRRSGRRGIVSKGWSNFGNDDEKPDNIYLIGNCPHDWLFKHCSAACHHGGAGTTAAGVIAGIPTVVVPWFGDQFFWGSQVQERKIGACVPGDTLTVEALSAAFDLTLDPSVQENAKEASAKIRAEDGLLNGVQAFHRHLPLENMVCDVDPTKLASVYCTSCRMKFSPIVDLIVHQHFVGFKSHHRYQYKHVDWSVTMQDDASDNLASGLLDGLIVSGADNIHGVAGLFTEPIKGAEQNGVKGALLGFGKGVGGLVAAPFDATEDLLKTLGSGFNNTTRDIFGESSTAGSSSSSSSSSRSSSNTSTPTPNRSNQQDGGVSEAALFVPARKEDMRKLKGQFGTQISEGLKGLGTGVFDGVTGLVVHPYEGMRSNGIRGLGVGLGKAVVDLPSKPLGGLFSFAGGLVGEVSNAPRALMSLVGADSEEQDLEESLSSIAFEQDEEFTKFVLRKYAAIVRKRNEYVQRNLESLEKLSSKNTEEQNQQFNFDEEEDQEEDAVVLTSSEIFG
eukprot:TRINITY_DN4346_c0_g1_i4.p1 TRINITY_DN4346_c0_g1~~TRINITY_DN4346_c0_g1_i4.p1  ORF type:complete len:780 (+),score=254.06 TRINITY_DN4346_c0_g1_i4:1390-3729(+)